MGVNKRLIGAGATDTGGGTDAITADNHFKAITYTGTGSSNQIGGLNFQPDLVWIKNIDSTANHVLVDSSRGRDGVLYSNSNSAEAPSPAGTDLASFDSSGFTVGTGNNANANVSSNNYVAWCWHANAGNTSTNSVGDITSTVQVNQPAGFSITTYTNNGNASNRVGHGLGLTPKICLIKKFSVSADWHFHTTAIDGSFDDIILNSTSAKTDLSLTAPTDTTFAAESGGSGENMICYSFADVEGYQKIGSYTGDSGTSHSINTGFKPAFLLIRRTDSGDNWVIFDSARNGTTNNNQVLFPNSDGAESNPNLGNGLDFTDTGFTLKTTDSSVNNSSGTYIYWAIAGTYPSETPTVEESFSAENWGGSDYRKNIMNNFRAGLVITRAKGESHHWGWYDIVRGVGKWLVPNNTGSESTGDYGPSAYNTKNTEFYGNHSPANSDYLNETYNGWFFKAGESTTSNTNGSITTTVSANAAAGFSIVKWTGTGSAGTLGHGLSAAPKFVIYKSATSTGEWVTWHTSYGGGDKYMYLNQNGAVGTQSSFYNGNPTSTVIYIGNHSDINASGQTCMAYCFTDISGFSSFGSYSGTGSLQTITTGFTPDFVVL